MNKKFVDSNVEAVLRKFEADDSDKSDGEDEDEEEDDTLFSKLKVPNIRFLNKEQESSVNLKKPKYNLGLNKDQEYEFRTAFKMISGNKDSLPINQMYELFQSLGYNFQDSEIEEMLKNSLQDLYGNYPVDIILEAFNTWLKKQISLDNLAAIFLMITSEGRIQRSLPDTTISVSDLTKNKDLLIEPKQLLNILRDILPDGNELEDDDGERLADEISSRPDHKVSFKDFVNLFKP